MAPEEFNSRVFQEYGKKKQNKNPKQSSIFARRSNKNTSPCSLGKRYVYTYTHTQLQAEEQVLMVFTKTENSFHTRQTVLIKQPTRYLFFKQFAQLLNIY